MKPPSAGSTMRSEAWRAPVDNAVYGVQFDDELTDELATRHAQRLLAKPSDTLTQQEQYDALAHAVANGDDLGANVPQSHSDAQLRQFLSTMLAEMDRLRPWTQPPLRRLPLDRWSDFKDAPPVAALKLSFLDVMQRLRQGFVPAPDDGRRVCLLALASGAEIALVANWWPETGTMAVLSQSKPEHVIEYLLAHTSLTENDLTPID